MDTEVELRSIEHILTEIIGRPSRWSGRVELTNDPQVFGKKPFGCDIIVNESLLGRDVRWRTLIHEMLHSYSAGYNRQDYDEARGWEEGVVEQLQRLLRPQILTRLFVVVNEGVFQSVEASHDYNRYVAALERLREALGHDEQAFYLRLLATPIRDRAALLVSLGRSNRPSDFRAYLDLFAPNNVILKTR